MNIMVIFGAVMIFIGIYLLIWAVKMRKSNDIKGNPILAEEDVLKCKDKKGFISYIYSREVAAGVAVMIIGVALILKELIEGMHAIANAVIIPALLVIMFFLYALGEAKKKFMY